MGIGELHPTTGEEILRWHHPNKDVYQTLVIFKRRNGLFKYDVWDSRVDMVTCYEYQIPVIVAMMKDNFFWDWENQVKFHHKSKIYGKVWTEGYERGFIDGRKAGHRDKTKYTFKPTDWDYGLED